MIVTYKWLSDFVDLQGFTPKKVADTFTSIGYEVDEMRELSKGMERVVVGKIEKLSRHPNADKLQVCQINIGQNKPVQILTAATNVFEGAIVPVALDGADLPNGKLIKTSNMRGLESQGMLCSGEELCIDDSVYEGASVDGIMIIREQDIPLGTNIAVLLGMDDVVYDLSVLANRPDCQSVKGLAKELATGLNLPLKDACFKYKAQKIDLPLSLEIKDSDCPYYLACVVKNVKIQPSPKWMQQRLKLVGLRPRNNIVDITNYVLWELGQPLHAFDYDKIAGQTIVVRKAKDGEKILTLDNKIHELTKDMTVICDLDKPIGLAGIMGGDEFSVNDTTKNIVFESATFKRESIRKTSRKLGIRSDASARYERGVTPISCVAGLDRALALIDKLKVGIISNEMVSNTSVDTKGREISFPLDYIKRLLGIEIPEMDMIRILGNLGITATIKGRKLYCIVPTIRTDIEGANDIIEELIRYYGFDHLNNTTLGNTTSIKGGLSQKQSMRNKVLDLMLHTGAHQVFTYSFIAPKQLDNLLLPQDSVLRNVLTISNPLSLDYSIMRTTLASSLFEVVANNLSHKNDDFALFELACTYEKSSTDNMPQEHNILSFVDVRNESDFYTTKSIVEMLGQNLGLTLTYKPAHVSFLHPNVSADIVWGNKVLGYIGKVHPKVCKNFEINQDCYYFELNIDMIPPKKQKKVKALSKFPASIRDMAVVVDEQVLMGDMLMSIKKAGGEMCEGVELFDVYRGAPLTDNQKSVAWKLTFRKNDSTITQQEVNDLFDKILNTLKTQFNAKLR